MKILLNSLCFLLLVGCGSNYTSDTTKETHVNTASQTNKVLVNESVSFSNVHSLLNKKCLSCHGSYGGFSLVNSTKNLSNEAAYNNILLFVNTRIDASKSVLLQKSIGEMNHGGSIIFTKSSYDYALISAWIDAGSSLDKAFDLNTSVTINNPGYEVPITKSSSFTKYHYNATEPVQGQACFFCHKNKEGEGDLIRFGGTLYSYIKTPDNEYYQNLKDYVVNVVGNKGTNFNAKVYPSSSVVGYNNFYQALEDDFLSKELFTVYIKDVEGNIVNQSSINSHSSISHRDCNRCHTQGGTNKAPGRILVPLAN